MTDRTQWEIEQLQKNEESLSEDIKNVNDRITLEIKEVNMNMSKELKALDRRLVEIEMFKTSTIERLKLIFQKLDNLREEGVWVKRAIAGGLISVSLGAISSLIIWLIQN